MKIKWMVLVLMLSGLVAEAQYPYVTQYTQNYFLINPAVAGLDSSSQLLFWNRNNINTNQNLRFNSMQLGYHTPIQNNEAGLGVKLTVDNPFGIRSFTYNITSLSGSYAYNFKFTENTDIRIGLGMGVHRYTSDNYNQVYQGRFTDYLFFYDFGAIFDFDDFLIGMSAASVNSPRTERNPGGPQQPIASVQRVITLMAKYNYQYTDYITLRPSLLLRNDGFGGDVSLELRGEADLWNTFMVGLGYRFTRFGQLQINPPYPYQKITLPDYVTIEAGGYISKLISVTLSYDTPIGGSFTAPSLIEGTVGLGL